MQYTDMQANYSDTENENKSLRRKPREVPGAHLPARLNCKARQRPERLSWSCPSHLCLMFGFVLLTMWDKDFLITYKLELAFGGFIVVIR